MLYIRLSLSHLSDVVINSLCVVAKLFGADSVSKTIATLCALNKIPWAGVSAQC